jgi:flagellar hook protein FlgE
MSIGSLYTAVSALQTHQQFMGVVANNLANVNTVGFKGSRVLFADALSQTLRPPQDASGLNGGGNGVQIGLGTSLASITPLFSQGSLQATGLPTDLAIEGDGFFVVSDGVTGSQYFTRAGAINVDQAGFLVTAGGQRIQGGDIGATNGDPLIDMQIPPDVGGIPVTSFSIDSAGRINVLLEDGTTSEVGNITLERFNNPQAMLKIGQNLYRETGPSGRVFNSYNTPGQNGVGGTRSGYLELSNVDLGQEFSDMIRAQRGLQANARTITTSDEIMQELINLKR